LLDKKERILNTKKGSSEILKEKISKAQDEIAKTKEIEGELYLEVDE
jgi:hypothetical protein